MNIKRSHYCGHITESLVDKEVSVCGWVDRYRDHGGVLFIDLRDREGIVQVVFDPESFQNMALASELRSEYVISVCGKVRFRPEGMRNQKLATGSIEVLVSKFEILNRSVPLPFSLHDDSPSQGETDENLRLKYRYLDLRKEKIQKNIRLRSEFYKVVRNFYYDEGFIEVETPILYKSTPEGARDFLVPSRLSPGEFYALPQSPQILKQLCMISGMDKYFQIARCFRDEDLRADRQPEFTQVDVEMSFVDREQVLLLHEKLMQKVFKNLLNKEIELPFPRMTYETAMLKYGSDKPDLRNPLELTLLTEQGKKSEFNVFKKEIENGAILKALCVEEREALARSELDKLPEKVAQFGVKGLSWIRIKSSLDWQGPLAKYFNDSLKQEVEALLPFKKQCLLFLVCEKQHRVNQALSFLRLEFGKRFKYTDFEKYPFLWVIDFPLYDYDEEAKRLVAAHHPFTSPLSSDVDVFFKSNDKDALLKIRAQAYDLVLNGHEIGGGSIRIYDPEVQFRMFELLGLDELSVKEKFGFFIDALKYGTPPHGGIAFGVDRIVMILSQTDAIREVIAFPKTQKGNCLMSSAPSSVEPEQLDILHLRIKHVDAKP